jgi:hypothetical protein
MISRQPLIGSVVEIADEQQNAKPDTCPRTDAAGGISRRDEL